MTARPLGARQRLIAEQVRNVESEFARRRAPRPVTSGSSTAARPRLWDRWRTPSSRRSSGCVRPRYSPRYPDTPTGCSVRGSPSATVLIAGITSSSPRTLRGRMGVDRLDDRCAICDRDQRTRLLTQASSTGASVTRPTRSRCALQDALCLGSRWACLSDRHRSVAADPDEGGAAGLECVQALHPSRCPGGKHRVLCGVHPPESEGRSGALRAAVSVASSISVGRRSGPR